MCILNHTSEKFKYIKPLEFENGVIMINKNLLVPMYERSRC